MMSLFNAEANEEREFVTRVSEEERARFNTEAAIT
jgi:hypothetical protein